MLFSSRNVLTLREGQLSPLGEGVQPQCVRSAFSNSPPTIDLSLPSTIPFLHMHRRQAANLTSLLDITSPARPHESVNKILES